MQIIPDPIFAAVMTIPFFVTLVLLNSILITPLREYLEGRDHAIAGARAEAEKLSAQAEAKVQELEAKLSEGRAQAAAIRQEHRARGLATERGLIEQARGAAEGEVGKAVAEIAAEADTARGELKGMAHAISVDIASRVLGRGIQA